MDPIDPAQDGPMNEEPPTLADRRNRLDVTQRELAYLAGVSLSTIQKAERNRPEDQVSAKNLDRIHATLSALETQPSRNRVPPTMGVLRGDGTTVTYYPSTEADPEFVRVPKAMIDDLLRDKQELRQQVRELMEALKVEFALAAESGDPEARPLGPGRTTVPRVSTFDPDEAD